MAIPVGFCPTPIVATTVLGSFAYKPASPRNKEMIALVTIFFSMRQSPVHVYLLVPHFIYKIQWIIL